MGRNLLAEVLDTLVTSPQWKRLGETHQTHCNKVVCVAPSLLVHSVSLFKETCKYCTNQVCTCDYCAHCLPLDIPNLTVLCLDLNTQNKTLPLILVSPYSIFQTQLRHNVYKGRRFGSHPPYETSIIALLTTASSA